MLPHFSHTAMMNVSTKLWHAVGSSKTTNQHVFFNDRYLYFHGNGENTFTTTYLDLRLAKYG